MRLRFLLTGLLLALHSPALPQDLPEGVRAVWDLEKAYRESTPTRERLCLNGLWRWQPAKELNASVPAEGWGYFKVPGSWPGITDYMQKDCQTLYPHPDWKQEKIGAVKMAWYQREFTVPTEWSGRRVSLTLEYLNSFALVWVDGQKAGQIHFPAGEIDLTTRCRPGQKHLLSLLVVAAPLKAVMLSYRDTFDPKEIQGSVERRGLCGDVYLCGTPPRARLSQVKASTSVRNWQIAVETAFEGLEPGMEYRLAARVTDSGTLVKEFSSSAFKGSQIKDGKYSFVAQWKPAKLWDTHTPQNQYDLSLSLLDSAGKVLDTALPERFGFREFWIDGRDFYLNGTRIFLCAVPLDNAQIGAAWATYQGTRESLQRLKTFGINFVYTHNYGCEPGTHLGFAEVLRAADDEGMLVSFSQPHFGQYDWKSPDADRTNGYARHAQFYVHAAGNHPSIVCYSMSHNSTGTEESMNPDMIDGVQDQRNQWSANGARQARRAEAIVNQLDPSRFVYHHSSGNLGTMHTANFYANFAPIQEMSDWLQHWATTGVKPLFLCEYGVPISWDWMMYRGWYKGQRTFGSARVPWELCLAEWNAQFFGDEAYQVTELEKASLRWEAARFRAGQVWNRWDYPRNAVGSADFELRNEIFAKYLTDNIRAFRSWGISAFCPWDHEIFWKLRDGVARKRKDLKTDWESLQRPGFSPDYVDDQMACMNASYERADWVPTVAAQALFRNNLPLLAYIAGKPSAFTSKDHNFSAGEAFEKQIIVINNSRQTVSARCNWSVDLPGTLAGEKELSIETGQQVRVPLQFVTPAQAKPGSYTLKATITFSNGETQQDSFAIDVVPPVPEVRATTKVAVFDPKGETRKLLGELRVDCTPVNPDTDLSAYDLLIVGRSALSPDAPAPDITRVRSGLKVLMFEQTSEVLEKRFGFRVAEYGLRTVFKRVPDHPVLSGINSNHLSNWRGEATLLPPKLKYEIGSRHAPEVKWCGIPVTRLWRAGNRGNVASVLIEKPACGDFLPILDGGFSLQFSPLLEYREGQGMILFCQLDVTGRTENDPAAQILTRNLLNYAGAWKPVPNRGLVYVGDPSGQEQLRKSGFAPRPYERSRLSQTDVLAIGPGGGKELGSDAKAVAEFLSKGGRILTIGLDQEEANSVLPERITTKLAEHISAFFATFGVDSLLAGVSPSDVHNRDPRPLPLVSSGATIIGDGVLAHTPNQNIVLCQLTPWSFASPDQNNLRRTYRRTSCLLTRLLANLGATTSTPLLERFPKPVQGTETRWLEGLYLDTPQEWDDPYRFFCW